MLKPRRLGAPWTLLGLVVPANEKCRGVGGTGTWTKLLLPHGSDLS